MRTAAIAIFGIGLLLALLWLGGGNPGNVSADYFQRVAGQ